MSDERAPGSLGRRRRTRQIAAMTAVLAVVAVGALLLVQLVAEDGHSSPPALVAAARSIDDAATVRFTSVLVVEGDPAAERVVQGALAGDSEELSLNVETACGALQLVLVGDQGYVVTSLRDRWLRVSGMDAGGDGPLGASAPLPNRLVRALTKLDDLRRFDPTDVDGSRLTHYSGTLGAGTVAPYLPELHRREVVGPAQLDVWLDEQDRVRRLLVEVPVGNRTASLDLELSGYGDRIRFERPADDTSATRSQADELSRTILDCTAGGTG